MPDRSPLRAARAAAFTCVCVVLAAAGHRLASGMWPPAASLVFAGGIVLLAADKLARRERSFRALAAGVLAGEAGLHLLFDASAGGMTAHLTRSMVAAHVAAGVAAAWWLRQGEAVLWTACRRFSAAALGVPRLLLAILAGQPALPALSGTAPRAASPGAGVAQLLRHALSRRGPPWQTACR
jgi:hypothetical protein